MEGMTLLDPEIDSKHRAAKLCQHQKIEPLITRTPKENWRIHPDWVQMYDHLTTESVPIPVTSPPKAFQSQSPQRRKRSNTRFLNAESVPIPITSPSKAFQSLS